MRSSRVFDYGKVVFLFEQFELQLAFSCIVDVITGASTLFRNAVTPDISDGVREQSFAGVDPEDHRRSRHKSSTCSEVL